MALQRLLQGLGGAALAAISALLARASSSKIWRKHSV
jgi:hypothetical protein